MADKMEAQRHGGTEFKMTELGPIPKDWEVETVGDAFQFLRNNTLPRACLSEFGTISDIHYGDVLVRYGNVLDFDKETPPFLAQGIVCRSIGDLLQDGDLIISDTAEDETVGKAVEIANLRTRKAVSGLHTVVCRSKKPFACGWLGNFVNCLAFHDQLLPFICGAKVSSVSRGNLKKIMILRPSIPEQRRIATALSDVDKLIASLDALATKKRAIRQGSMQELLTGKKRLPRFTGEWVHTTLGSLISFKKGELLSSKDYCEGSIPVVAGGQTPAGVHNVANRTGVTITISASGAYAGYVAKFHEPIFASDCTTIGESDSYDINFIYNWLKLHQDSIYERQRGGAQPHVHSKDLAPLSIEIPVDIAEQQAIASVLSDMDAEIAALDAKAEKMRAVKAGMMQELLTGRKRI